MNKYQWPASQLTEEEMEILFRMRQKTSKSICELLKKAVHIAYGKETNHATVAGEDSKHNT